MATFTEAPRDSFALGTLESFYRLHAPIYDLTRPLILRGRRRAITNLAPQAEQLVLDVGCGTGWSLPRLHRSGAQIVGVECSASMRARAQARIRRRRLGDRVELDPRPYGSHDDYTGRVDRILFSYSLSMIPCFEEVLGRARSDLRPGGIVGVVDFLDARRPVDQMLSRSHVFLGPQRLSELRCLFPRNRVSLHRTRLWSYYLFCGRA